MAGTEPELRSCGVNDRFLRPFTDFLRNPAMLLLERTPDLVLNKMHE
jgi:hypothetical protein